MTFRALRLPRWRLRFVDRLPGCGLRVYRIARGAARAEPALRAERLPGGGAAIENERVRLEAQADGRLRWIDRRSGSVVEDALRIVSEGDRGDEYNFDPVPRGERVEAPGARAREARARLAGGGLARRSTPATGCRPRWLRAVTRARDARSGCRCACSCGSRAVWLASPSRSTSTTRRGITGCACTCALPSRRRVARWSRPSRSRVARSRRGRPALGASVRRSFRSAPLPSVASPRSRTESSALTVANRGCAEVEAVPETDGTTSLALTLLRAVGWLSRGDLALRPMHAGPALETPGAQVPGPHRVELGFWLHADGGSRARRRRAPLRCAGVACSRRRAGRDALLRDGARLLEIDDPAVVVSAIEPRAQSTPLIRLYNASDAARRVALRWCGPGAQRLEPVDLTGRATRARGLRRRRGRERHARAAPLADRESHQPADGSRCAVRAGRLRSRCAERCGGAARPRRAACAAPAHELRMQQRGQHRSVASAPRPRAARAPRAKPAGGPRAAVKKCAAGPDELPASTEFSRAASRGWRVARGRAAETSRQAVWLPAPRCSGCWRRAAFAAEPALPAAGSSAAPVASERLVPEEEWASDLVDALALDRALPDAPRPADFFSLLCAEQVGAGGRLGRAQRSRRSALRSQRRRAAAAPAGRARARRADRPGDGALFVQRRGRGAAALGDRPAARRPPRSDSARCHLVRRDDSAARGAARDRRLLRSGRSRRARLADGPALAVHRAGRRLARAAAADVRGQGAHARAGLRLRTAAARGR